MQRDTMHGFPNSNILKNYITISPSGYGHRYSQDTEYFHHHRVLFCCPCISIPTSLYIYSSLTPGYK